jgi:hypothetical protein
MFNHEELVVWVDHEHGAADASVEIALCVDSLAAGTQVVGRVSVPVLDWTRDANATDETLDLRGDVLFGAAGAVGVRQGAPLLL